MNKKEKFALLLGMLCGDGCLPVKFSGEGYRDYPIQFYNADEKLVILFKNLFKDIFGVDSKIYSAKRMNKEELFQFCKYSKVIYQKIQETGFPIGVKRDILRIPKMIFRGTKKEKVAFIYGVLITDGCLRKRGDILFHSGSKLFLEDLSLLISNFTGTKKPVREYVQRKVYYSYQLNLNKPETEKILLAYAAVGQWYSASLEN